jgi:hypothetical protein
MNETNDAEWNNAKEKEVWNEAKEKELNDRVDENLKAYEGCNFLEQYAIYMIRVQMYELSLKQDLIEIFKVSEEKVETMNLASILRYYEKHDIRAHILLYFGITNIAAQRNFMAHEFLARLGWASMDIGEEAVQIFHKEFSRCARNIETALQRYLMLKETDLLYKDYGVEAKYPYPVAGFINVV